MRSAPFKQPIKRPTRIPDPSENPWFWHPSNVYARRAPEYFRAPLRAQMGEELDVTWNPVIERWQVWTRAPKIQHPVCQGWRLLFIHNAADGSYLPLDERVYARLYSASARVHGDGKKYFDRIQSEYWRDQERKEKRLRQEAVDQAMPFWEHSQIKNIGKGNKFSTYHA